MISDDLPWPELGNVSRGATRGNQGAKGSLGLPDVQGRAILQLRVQPNILAVKLNPTATSWYRLLDSEVQRALKETKTYWRKARRRQDYDARADQDHMELHEWLQQLKDKAMAHLELLLQKGEITGPPYVMPDHLEFTFMRGFIERQRTGVPHNPRLRGLPRSEQYHIPPEELTDDDPDARGSPESISSPLKSPVSSYLNPRQSSALSSPPWPKYPAQPLDLSQKIEASQNILRQAKQRLKSAQAASKEAFARYNALSEEERALEAQIIREEVRLEELIATVVRQSESTVASMGGTSDPQSSRSANPGPSTPIGSAAHEREPDMNHELVMHVLQPGPSSQMPPSSQPQAQPQTQLPQHIQNQQHTHPQQTHQAMHPYQSQTYSWTHFPPRSNSSVSTTSAVGGNLEIDMELAQRNRAYPVDLGAPSNSSAEREWAAVTGEEGIDGINENSLMHVSSPHRKHRREEWDQTQSPSIRESRDDSTTRPPRKRLNQVEGSRLTLIQVPSHSQTHTPNSVIPVQVPSQTHSPHTHSIQYQAAVPSPGQGPPWQTYSD